MPVIRSVGLLAALTLAAAPLHAQTPVSRVAPREMEQFRFFIGEWTFTAESRLPGLASYAGDWSAKATTGGFVIEDEFRVRAASGPVVYVAKTYRTFNTALGQWEEETLDVYQGTWHHASGHAVGPEMEVEQRGTGADSTARLRIRYGDIADDHFTWRADRSDDGGGTWTRNYIVIHATRRRP